MKQKLLKPIIKVHRGKQNLTTWIVKHFPDDYEQYDYLEPYCGSASILLGKSPVEDGKMEILNDTDLGIIRIFQALRDEPKYFISKIRRTTFSERVFNKELKKNEEGKFKDYIDEAANEFILRRMSRGGDKKIFARPRGEELGIKTWKEIASSLNPIAKRVQNTFIFNKPAIQTIAAFNEDNTLLYCDPPNASESSDVGENEMAIDEHEILAKQLNKFHGKVILSGYPSTLYKRLYEEWRCVRRKTPKQKGKKIKTETIWLNY